jgi:ferric-dicitrate binding protein FerR (iron transport regulator)
MADKQPDTGHFSALLERFRNGEATPEEMAELEGLLNAHASLRRIFANDFLLEVQLFRAFPERAVSTEPQHGSWRSRRRLVGWLAAAVVLVGLGLLFFFLNLPTAKNLVVSGRVLVQGTSVSEIGAELPFEVTGAEPAVLRLSDNSEVELAPASKAVLHGKHGTIRQAVELQEGSGKFKVARAEGTFRVETVVGFVSALGTEFTVKLQMLPRQDRKDEADRGRGRQSMTIQVLEGSVNIEINDSIRTGNHQEPRPVAENVILFAGETRSFSSKAREEHD